MKSLELFEFVRKLSLYFERKMPSDDTLQQWLPEVEYIPSEPLDWIAKQIMAGDTWPRNLPAAIKKGWHDWWQENPDRRAKDRQLGCDGCHLGYIYVAHCEEGMGNWYDTTFRCAHCRPKNPRDMTAATVEQLLRSGYCQPIGTIVLPYAKGLPQPGKEKPAQSPPVERAPVDKIVGNVVDGMELPF